MIDAATFTALLPLVADFFADAFGTRRIRHAFVGAGPTLSMVVSIVGDGCNGPSLILSADHGIGTMGGTRYHVEKSSFRILRAALDDEREAALGAFAVHAAPDLV